MTSKFYNQEHIDKAVRDAQDWKAEFLSEHRTDTEIAELCNAHCHNKNKKLGKSTLVFNTGSASRCPSLAMGRCQVGEKCYALSDEKCYKSTVPYRERQALLWTFVSPDVFAYSILEKNARRRTPCTHFRYSESGDFSSQEHLQWIAQVCSILSDNGIICYGYTARTDLNLDALVKSSQVNASNTLDNYNPLTMNRFKAMLNLSDKIENTCLCSTGGDCGDCTLCKTYNGLVQIKIHK